MPLKWELQPAVDHIVRKLAQDEPLIQFPGVFHALLWAAGCVVPAYVKHELARMRLPPYVGGMQYFGRRRSKGGKGKQGGAAGAGAGEAAAGGGGDKRQ